MKKISSFLRLPLLVLFVFSTTLILESFPVAFATVLFVNNCTDLQNIQLDAGTNYRLSADIDCQTDTHEGGSLWNSGAGFAPITGFSGSLDGQGHVIKNLFINRSGSSYVGLFSNIDTGGLVHNLGVVDADVTGGSYTAILAGRMRANTLDHIYTTGTVHGGGYAGGVVGTMDGVTIGNSYSWATVTGTGYCGGFQGVTTDFLTNSASTITNSYAKGTLSCDSKEGFGLNGSFRFPSVYTHVFYDSSTTGSSGGGGTAKTTAEMMTEGTFTGWTFTVAGDGTIGDWIMAGYPHLQMENRASISTAVELQLMDVNRGGSYTIANDITFDSNKTLWNGGAGFDPIGLNESPGNRFTGTLNGQNHRIKDLYINRPSTVYTALISNTYGSGVSISNIGLVDANVTGDFIVGALVGLNNGGTISQAYSTGAINGNSSNGGLVGYSLGNSASITNSYSTATVTAATGGQTGGLVGINGNSDNPSITKCFSTGSVTGTPDSTGGLVGSNVGTVTNSFYDTTTSGMSDSSGKGTPKTTAQMKNVATFTDETTPGLTAAWDFVGNPNNDVASSDIWNIDGFNNNGYPFLSWQELQPVGPTGLTVTATGLTNVHISWTDVANNDGYKIDLAAGTDDSVFPTSGVQTVATPNLTSYDWTALNPNTRYIAKVGAYNDIGTSYVVSDPFYTLASVPTGLLSTAISKDSTSFSWTGDGTSYIISNDTVGTTSTSASASATINSLKCDTTYTFSVKALNGDGIQTAYSSGLMMITDPCGGSIDSKATDESNLKRAQALQAAKDAAAKLVSTTLIPFKDTAGHWAKSYSETLQKKCDIQGYKDAKGNSLHLFGPDDSSTRAELVKIIVGCRTNGIPKLENNLFKDVAASEWYAPYISYARSQGWVDGFKDGGFHPDEKVTRAEALKMVLLAQYLDKQITPENNIFKDVEAKEWYYKFITFALSKKFVSGYVDNSGVPTGFFGTKDPITRSEIAKIIVNVQGL